MVLYYGMRPWDSSAAVDVLEKLKTRSFNYCHFGEKNSRNIAIYFRADKTNDIRRLYTRSIVEINESKKIQDDKISVTFLLYPKKNSRYAPLQCNMRNR